MARIVAAPVESFPALTEIPGLVHGFFLRTPGVDVDSDKDEVLKRLEPSHAAARKKLKLDKRPLLIGEQVHGAEVLLVDEANAEKWDGKQVPGVDGFVTQLPDVTLGIHVADCAAVYFVDPVNKAIGLAHSGRKGSELKISSSVISLMRLRCKTRPSDLVVQISPCIRPPAYEIDFAAMIRENLAGMGVPEKQIHDGGTCTSKNLKKYYSYRVEKGKTGRMLAVMGWES